MAKKAAPKAAESKPAEKSSAAKKAATKSEIYASLAESTTLTKKQVQGVFETYLAMALKELGKKGPGVVLIPGVGKLKVVRKPATKAKQGINPFTKEPMTIKAKPARNVVKFVALKSLKESV